MKSSTQTQFTISCRSVWKIFGPNPGGIRPLIDQGLSRNEILAQTGHVIAVKDVSFDVRPGEIFVVMGLSGSGKSTLIRCLSRLVEPTSGEIIVNGQDVVGFDATQLRELRRHKMSMVFQRFGLFPHRSILDNVSYGLEVQGIKKEQRHAQARQVLEMVGLKGWEQHFPHELSGGMQQRVGLARALAVDPEILLCDEPFSALDPLIRREMQDELLRLQKTLNKTLVFITHDFLEAIKLGHHIAIMKDGEIVQLGKPEEIVAHPVNDYVREFTRDVPRIKILTARTIMTVAATDPDGEHVSVHADTNLEALIGLTAVSDDPLVVLDDEGCVIGMVDRTAVLQALTEGN